MLYAAYNPIPNYNGRIDAKGTAGRNPMVLRKSLDGGKTWGPLNILGDEPERGYSYPALFQTRDGHLMIGLCMGSGADGNNLCRLGIYKVEINSIE